MAREIESDYCIAGAGIAGLLVASKLAESGKQILILDQGPDISENDRERMREAAIRGLDYGADYNDGLDASVPTPTTSVAPSGTDPAYAYQRLFGTGGTALHFQGAMLRPVEDDLKAKTLYGYGRDWAIDYAELEPWLQRAEEEVGVAGNREDNPYAAPRSKAFPMPAHPYSWFDKEIFRAARHEAALSAPRRQLEGVRRAGRVRGVPLLQVLSHRCPLLAGPGSWRQTEEADQRDFRERRQPVEFESMFIDPEGKEIKTRDGTTARQFLRNSRTQRVRESFEAMYSPRGDDGRPMKLVDRETGVINREVAKAWQKYDISLILRERWEELASRLKGKLHIYVGTLDEYRLDEAVKLVKAQLEALDSDAEVLLVKGRDHMGLWEPHPELWPQGMWAKIYRDIGTHIQLR